MAEIFRCSLCHSIFLECDLVQAKVSENYVGTYISDYCPKCKARWRLALVHPVREKESERNV